MIWVNYIQLANLEKYKMSNMGTNISPPSRHFEADCPFFHGGDTLVLKARVRCA